MLLVAVLAVACGPYVTPRLPIFQGDEVRYSITPITARTIEQWHPPMPPSAVLPIAMRAKHDDNYDYVLGPGDLMRLIIYTFDATGEQSAIRVFPEGLPLAGEDEFLVEADGSIMLPYAGRLQVGGKPFAQVEKMVERGLRKYFVHPQFQVRVTQFGHGRALITGEVENPGEVFLQHRPLTVANAISEAGGLLPTADLSAATLTRANGLIEPLDLTAMYFLGDNSANKVLHGGDQLTIPRGHANQLFITGEVLQPQTIAMHPVGFSLPEALQQVGWLNPVTGDPSHIYVLRVDESSFDERAEVQIYHLDAADLTDYALADQFMMRPRDIVYVAMQPITRWDRVLSQFLPGGLSTIIGPQVGTN